MTNIDGGSEGTPIFENTLSQNEGHRPDTSRDEDRSMADTAKEQAGRVADSAVDAGKDVAHVAKDEALNVAEEAKVQAKDLLRETQVELREQAAVQQKRVADGLRSIGAELQQMAGASQAQGVASDLVGQAGRRSREAAAWLSERDPGSLLQEVKSYARRSPGTFIAAAAVVGVLAGRLTRALATGDSEPDAGPAAAGRARMTDPDRATQPPTQTMPVTHGADDAGAAHLPEGDTVSAATDEQDESQPQWVPLGDPAAGSRR